MKHAFEKAGFDRLRFELRAVALQFSREDWIAIYDEATQETAGKGHSRVDAHIPSANSRQPNPEPGGQPRHVTQPISAPSAREPIPGSDQERVDAQKPRVADQEPKPGRRDQKAIEAHFVRVPASRAPKPPNMPRSVAEVRTARIETETLFDYKLFGRRIRDLSRADLIKAHAQAARELKTSLLIAAKDVYNYALLDQMLKHCQADGKTSTTKMFKPTDLQRFDQRAKEMINKQAVAVADIGTTYLMQKTLEMSDARP